MPSNPLTFCSERAFGLPDFGSLTPQHYREAIEEGMAHHEQEIAAIARNSDAPSVENTVIALERSGRVLNHARRILANKVAADSTEELRELDAELAPRLAAHADAVLLDPDLFERIAIVHSQLSELDLDPETEQLVKLTHDRSWLAGAGLPEEKKARLRELNQELSRLTTDYQRKLLADTNESAVPFTSADELDGLNEGQLSACAQAARDRGLDGWLVTHTLFSDHPYNAQLVRRESRRRIHQASTARCRRGNEHDTSALVLRITALRAERAALLGHPNHASAALADQTARTLAAVDEMVYPLAGPALANLHKEAQILQEALDAHQASVGEPTHPLEPWDWSYWAERVRSTEHQVDTAQLRPWFELERVLHDGVFWTATQLFGITFTARPDIVTYHEEARAFEVKDADGSTLGLFILDVFTRDSKRGGAWMNNLVEQNRLFDELPVVCNNLNVPKPAPGEPVLLSLDEVTTLFHEFGHALHGLLSDVTYPSLSGTHVPRDFVEFPSQVNEMWITWPEVVNHYARHHETGDPIDPEVLRRMATSSTFNEGFATTEYLASALLDQEWHRISADDVVQDVQLFEQQALERVGLANPWVPPRYGSCYFSHTFSGGYDAKYYCYIFSEVMDADTVEWFRENGGLTRANGDRFREAVLSTGHSRNPLDSFREFRGRDADLQPLLVRRGLA
ncbi:M3 family metallopeptidase [Luteococcus sp. Sow4_B9]|uniref:M3 family metallopeptidase n=1 Tax=Luteococcus sp. Sow4_B9 TaxID=3438792 RepID=UPI003F98654B